MNVELLKNRDFSLLIDRSGSMARPVSPTNSKTRWAAMQEVAYGLAAKMSEYDPDGISMLPFDSSFQRFDNVTATKVDEVFTGSPNGSTALHLVLKDQLDNFFARKAAGQLKANGETIVIITDGEPDDKLAVQNLIVEASKKLDKDEELAILFAQIGDDAGATAYLKKLDDGLETFGAKFDIVDTKTFDQIGTTDLVQVLLDAITD